MVNADWECFPDVVACEKRNICVCAAGCSFTAFILFCVNLFSTAFCNVKLPSKAPFDKDQPYKIHSLEHHRKKLFSMKRDYEDSPS